MKLRILVGESKVWKHAKANKLKTLYKSPKLVIQGSDDITTIQLNDGRQAFIAGNLVGMRTSQGELAPCSFMSASIQELISTSSIEKCQDALEGRFLLAVAGPNDDCRICSDRYGQLDIYYQTLGKAKIFASDLSLLPDSPAKKGFNQTALAYALIIYGCRPPKRDTLYQDIHRLGVGEIVHIGNGELRLSETPFQPAPRGNYGERELNEFADLLLDAIRVRGSPYGNVVYLSSGWDSTSILACLVHLFGARRVRAVIGRMKYAERSGVINQFEIERAQAVADYFGIRLDIVEFDYRREGPLWVDRLRPLFKSHHISSLTGMNHTILADFVAQTTNGNEPVFAGEISDGAFNLGFSQFTTIYHPSLDFREYSDKMACYLFGPTFLGLLQNGQFINDPVYDLLRRHAGKAFFDKPAAGAPKNRTQQLLASFFLRAKRLPLWSLRNSKMLSKEGAAAFSTEMESTYLSRAAEAASQYTLYTWYLHLYNSFHWQSSTVATLSLTAEANGLNMALPFWDSRIQEFLYAMPEQWGRGLDLNPTKYPLKWMLKNRVDYPLHLQVGPHSYLYDVVPTFSLSAEIMYGSAFAPYFKKLLRSRAYHDLLSPEMFDLTYIDVIVNRYLKGIEVTGAELNDLISLRNISMMGLTGE